MGIGSLHEESELKTSQANLCRLQHKDEIHNEKSSSDRRADERALDLSTGQRRNRIKRRGKTRPLSAGKHDDQAINRRIVASEGRLLVGSPARDEQIGEPVELVAPKTGRPERFLPQILSQVVVETA
jgi:hypothetical protein